MNDSQKILRHDAIITLRESVKDWFNSDNCFFAGGPQEMYNAKLSSLLAKKYDISILEVNEIIISYLFGKGFSNEFINEQLIQVNKIFAESLYLMTKFKIGDVLFANENNSKIKVKNILPLKYKQIPIYSVIDEINNFEYLIEEINLFKNDKFISGAKFRVGEIVYTYHGKRHEHHKKYEIIEILKEKDILDGFSYKCIDRNGKIFIFNQLVLSLYNFKYITR